MQEKHTKSALYVIHCSGRQGNIKCYKKRKKFHAITHCLLEKLSTESNAYTKSGAVGGGDVGPCDTAG